MNISERCRWVVWSAELLRIPRVVVEILRYNEIMERRREMSGEITDETNQREEEDVNGD